MNDRDKARLNELTKKGSRTPEEEAEVKELQEKKDSEPVR